MKLELKWVWAYYKINRTCQNNPAMNNARKEKERKIENGVWRQVAQSVERRTLEEGVRDPRWASGGGVYPTYPTLSEGRCVGGGHKIPGMG